MYHVEVDWCPAYEALFSLEAYYSRGHYKTLELGPEWVRSVRASLSPDALEVLRAATDERILPLTPLIRRCPGERSVEGVLAWLESLSPGDLYELVAPEVVRDARTTLADLGGERDATVRVFRLWNGGYFQHIDPAILSGLQQNADFLRGQIATTPPDVLVERATNGLQLLDEDVPETVILIPQYHYRPWNIYDVQRSAWHIAYPADALPTVPGEPPARLLRLVRALSDENRLRILHFLAEQPRTFTEIQRFSGLSKGTVHHHMVALRAAGLVHVRGPWTKTSKLEKYILRPEAIDILAEMAREYLKGKSQ